MYRKTHFKSRPDLVQELGKEFEVYLFHMAALWKRVITTYPKQIFILMFICIVLSSILAFTVMRVGGDVPKPRLPDATADVGHEFGKLIDAGQALDKVLSLQNQINIILHKDSLTTSDSLLVKHAIRQLEMIHQQLNAKPNH